MNVYKISPISFWGKIIDSHAHVGHHDGKIYTKEDLDIFIKEKLPNNDTVEKMLVSDLDVLHSLRDEYDGNKNMLNVFPDKNKYAIIASCSPKDGDIKLIEKLFTEHPTDFVGLKFHPTIQNLELSRPEYKPYLEFAQINNLPCLFHTDVLTDNEGHLVKKISKSDPEAIYQLSKCYKNVPVVLAHLGAGWNEAHDKTINVLLQSIKNGDANIYADISWVDIDAMQKENSVHKSKDHIIKAIKALKGIGDNTWKYGDQSFRLMFGSDAPLGRFKDGKNPIKDYTDFIEDIKFAIRDDGDLKADAEKIIDDLFYKNAEKLYNNAKKNMVTELKNNLIKFNESEKHSFKVNLAGCMLIIVTGIFGMFEKNKTSNK